MTRPKEIIRHDISDDDLTRLNEGAGGFSNAFWTFLGVGLGLGPQASIEIYAAFCEEAGAIEPLSRADLAFIILCGVSLAVAICLAVVDGVKISASKRRIESIRKRRLFDYHG